ncbi:MAG TPA: hypothetical protein VHJ76_03510 [Actinomycetota bacterium]|nr:hypothetical protein [Actinomycetota bacterium]
MAPIRDQDVEFERIDFTALEPVCVVAQSLDNQWVPRRLLARMLKKGRSLEDVDEKRQEFVRAEYLRALVNARQVVVNRAYLYNNPAVFRDYEKPGPGRDAFEELLGSRVVVPFLFNEPAPHHVPSYTTDAAGFAGWLEVCREVKVPCLRLSWDDAENVAYIVEQLAGRFGDFAQSINRLDVSALGRELELDPDRQRGLKARLTEVSHRCVDLSGSDERITREGLYKEFVVADGTDPAEGKYDAGKPFAGEIKQLLDLDYNVNLPDALRRFPLTPADALHRTALQEWRPATQDQRELSPDELLTILKNVAFDLVQGAAFIKSLGALSLPEIVQLRGTWEWRRYVDAVEGLVADPLTFVEGGAAEVYGSYVALAETATRMAAEAKRQELSERWIPRVEVVVEVAGAVLSVLWGDRTEVKVAGEVSKAIGEKPAAVIVRLVVRGLTERGSRAELSTSVDFMRGRFDRAQSQWDELVRALSKTRGFEQLEGRARERRTANIDYSEELYR